MKIYTDKDFKCHTEQTGGSRGYDVDFFDGKCEEYILGYRYIPSGKKWIRNDGVVFLGEAIFPWTDYSKLELYQLKYEAEKENEETLALLADVAEEEYEMALKEIG